MSLLPRTTANVTLVYAYSNDIKDKDHLKSDWLIDWDNLIQVKNLEADGYHMQGFLDLMEQLVVRESRGLGVDLQEDDFIGANSTVMGHISTSIGILTRMSTVTITDETASGETQTYRGFKDVRLARMTCHQDRVGTSVHAIFTFQL